MALERPYEAEQVARNAMAERAARRDDWRALGRTLVQLACWVALGLFLMGWGLHSTDRAMGGIFWLAGQTIWLSGVLFTLLAAYRRGNQRVRS